MAATKSTTAKNAKSTATAVEIKEEGKNGKQTLYKVAQAELDRLGNDDAAGRKVDKALEDARGKDTWRTHVQLVAVQEVDDRAEARFTEATKTRANQFDALQKKADNHHQDLSTTAKSNFTALQKKADDNHKGVVKVVETGRDALIDLTEQQFTDTNAAINTAQTEIVREVATTRDEVLNGQAVLGEAINTAQKAAAKDAEGIVKLVEKNLASLAESQGEDGKTILETLKTQHEATVELIQNVHADIEAKLSYFREEFDRAVEKLDTVGGNQHASVRGDLNVVMSLLSDIRKDQIGRPERR